MTTNKAANQLKGNFKDAFNRGSSEAYLLQMLNAHLDWFRIMSPLFQRPEVIGSKQEDGWMQYYYGLVNLTPHALSFKHQLIRHYDRDIDYTKEKPILLGKLAACFIMDGHEDCRNALYKYAQFNPSETNSFEAFVVLDGLDGGLWLINNIGHYLSINPKATPNPHLWTRLQNDYPELSNSETLIHAFKCYPLLSIYIAYAEQCNAPQDLSSATDLEATESPVPHYTEDEIKDYAKLLTKPRHRGREIELLSIFNQVPYPLHLGFIARHVKTTIKDDDLISKLALSALLYFRNEYTRTFALERVLRVLKSYSYVDILARNYRVGDLPYWEMLINNRLNVNHLNYFGECLTKLYVRYPNPEILNIINILLRKLNQPSERYPIYAKLAEIGCLNRKMMADMRYDAHIGTRALYQIEFEKTQVIIQEELPQEPIESPKENADN